MLSSRIRSKDGREEGGITGSTTGAKPKESHAGGIGCSSPERDSFVVRRRGISRTYAGDSGHRTPSVPHTAAASESTTGRNPTLSPSVA